jgi:co-chaperonin GroES (HSP10)
VVWCAAPPRGRSPRRARIIAAGPGRHLDNGDHVALDVKEGNRVIFSKYDGAEAKWIYSQFSARARREEAAGEGGGQA